jgi:hypothetical protein
MQVQVLDGGVQGLPLVENGNDKSRCGFGMQAALSAT